MHKYCEKCEKDYDCALKKCPVCGEKLTKQYTEEELEKIQKQNDDFTVINTLFMQ
jgi:hypothetical protein